MLAFKQYLVEDNSRLAVLKEKFRPLISKLDHRFITTPAAYDKLFDNVVAADPSKNHQYVQWIFNMLIKRSALAEDLGKIHQDLVRFEKLKPRIPAEFRDIGRYKQYQDLYDVLERFNNTKSTKGLNPEEFKRLRPEFEILYEGPEGGAYIPLTAEASTFLGKQTRWCTTSENGSMFNSYNSRGPLVIFITEKGEKYQLHATFKGLTWEAGNSGDPAAFMNAVTGATGQFCDAQDRQLADNNPFFHHPLYMKVMSLPAISSATLATAFKHRDVKLLKIAVKSNPDSMKICQSLNEIYHDIILNPEYSSVFSKGYQKEFVEICKMVSEALF